MEGAAVVEEATRDRGRLRQRRKVSDAAQGQATGSEVGEVPRACAEAGKHPPRSKLRRFLALQAVFLFSGLWHIMIFW